jgi:hypothetical protein
LFAQRFCLIANPPAPIGIANALGSASPARSGRNDYRAWRNHDSRSDIGSAHAIRVPMPSRSTSSSDRGDQPWLALIKRRERHGFSGGGGEQPDADHQSERKKSSHSSLLWFSCAPKFLHAWNAPS